jgi:hypothetical protein
MSSRISRGRKQTKKGVQLVVMVVGESRWLGLKLGMKIVRGQGWRRSDPLSYGTGGFESTSYSGICDLLTRWNGACAGSKAGGGAGETKPFFHSCTQREGTIFRQDEQLLSLFARDFLVPTDSADM